MFTGIIQATAQIIRFEPRLGSWRLGLQCAPELLCTLQIGASIAVDGVCLTVVEFQETCMFFDLIAETYHRTCFQTAQIGEYVNIERAVRFGDEIGGHWLSGHIQSTATIVAIDQSHQQYIITCQTTEEWIKYLFPKGYIGLSGASLTIVAVNPEQHTFTVHLIPETLRVTTLSSKRIGMALNLEIDYQTQVMVTTVTRILPDMLDKIRTK